MQRQGLKAVARTAGTLVVCVAVGGLFAAGLTILTHSVQSYLESRDTARVDDAANANRVRLLKLLVARGRSAAEAERLASQRPTKHELQVLSEVVFPDELHTTFADIGGHRKLKRDLYDAIILPLQNPALL